MPHVLSALYADPSFQFCDVCVEFRVWRSGSRGGPVRRGRGEPVMGVRERYNNEKLSG